MQIDLLNIWVDIAIGIVIGVSYGIGYVRGERSGMNAIYKEYAPILEEKVQRIRDIEFALQTTFPAVFGQRTIKNVELN